MAWHLVARAVAIVAGSLATIGTAPAQQLLRHTIDPNLGDAFGTGMSWRADVTGDGVADLLVGAPGADCTASNDGEVLVYSGSDGSLFESFCGLSEALGAGLCYVGDVDGDGVPDLWIGAPNYQSPTTGTATGRAYLHSGATGALITRFDGEATYDAFGSALTGLGDVDGDGVADLLVASEMHTVGTMSGAGRVYLYSGATLALLRTHDGAAQADHFGHSLAGVGDADGDGVDDYAIGAILYGANDTGSVQLFSGRSGALLWSLTGARQFSQLGVGIAGGLDWNGDGFADVIVGSPENYPTLGRVEVHSGFDGSLLASGTGQAGEGFGKSVANVGDMNGDGYPEIFVGAPDNSLGAFAIGRASLRSGRTLRELYDFEAPIVVAYELGAAVSGGFDVDGDGIPDLSAGAQGGAARGPTGGEVMLYSGNDLFLQASPTDVTGGQVVTVATRGGPAGAITVVVLIDVNGAPTFVPLVWSTLDANGESTFSGKVPKGFAGVSFSLLAFAQKSPGGAGIIDSSAETITIH